LSIIAFSKPIRYYYSANVNMEEIIESLKPISRFLDRIQSILALDFLNDFYSVEEDSRVNIEAIKSATLATVLGIQWGFHFSCGCFLLWISLWQRQQQQQDNTHRLAMAAAWCFYITAICSFHLLEFFITAFFNTTVVSSDSFLIDHSKAYTVAAIIASIEFWFRFLYWSSRTTTTTQDTTTATNYLWMAITVLGIIMVVTSQFTRSWAMMKCGESFNHYIQNQKKDNHILVTNGIYSLLRHPSYVGFYYWSIGTQLVLHNPMSGLLFAVAGWKFFSQRIPYEERSLIRLFGDEYHSYVMRTYVGIPFMPLTSKDKNKEKEDEKDHQQVGTELKLKFEAEKKEVEIGKQNGIEYEICKKTN